MIHLTFTGLGKFTNMDLRRATILGGLTICSLLWANLASPQLSWSLKRSGMSTEVLTKIVSLGNFDALSISTMGVEQPDGPMPETAHQEIILKSGGDTAITSVKAACSELGLSPPVKDLLATEPSLVCIGRYNGESVSVYAKLSCETNCKLMLETRAIGF